MTNSPQESDDAEFPSNRLIGWIAATLLVGLCSLAYWTL